MHADDISKLRDFVGCHKLGLVYLFCYYLACVRGMMLHDFRKPCFLTEGVPCRKKKRSYRSKIASFYENLFFSFFFSNFIFHFCRGLSAIIGKEANE